MIDWTNARAGPAGADVAMAYLIMGSSEVDQVPALVRPLLKSIRAALIGQFLSSVRDDPKPTSPRWPGCGPRTGTYGPPRRNGCSGWPSGSGKRLGRRTAGSAAGTTVDVPVWAPTRYPKKPGHLLPSARGGWLARTGRTLSMWMFLSRRLRAWVLLAIALPLTRLFVHRLASAAERRDPATRTARALHQADSAVTAVSRRTSRRAARLAGPIRLAADKHATAAGCPEAALSADNLLDAGSDAAKHRVDAERLADKALDRLADAVEVVNDWLR